MLGEEDQSHGESEILFRLARHQSHGEIQSAAHAAQCAVVSGRAMGLVLWPGLLVVRVRRALVSRLARLGLPAANGLVVRQWLSAAGSAWPMAKRQSGADGTLAIDIDTAAAKAVHPDEDHEYQITAEVVDPSRRTIVGSGSVLVARKPFQVTAWVDRGYYHVGGDQVEAEASPPVRSTANQSPAMGISFCMRCITTSRAS